MDGWGGAMALVNGGNEARKRQPRSGAEQRIGVLFTASRQQTQVDDNGVQGDQACLLPSRAGDLWMTRACTRSRHGNPPPPSSSSSRTGGEEDIVVRHNHAPLFVRIDTECRDCKQYEEGPAKQRVKGINVAMGGRQRFRQVVVVVESA